MTGVVPRGNSLEGSLGFVATLASCTASCRTFGRLNMKQDALDALTISSVVPKLFSMV